MPSSSTEPKRGSAGLNILLAVLSTVVVFLLIEGLASLLMSARAAKHALYMREESHSQYDADLGWSHKPGLRFDDLYGDKASFTTNAQGFRGLENYERAVPAGKYRVVALGDSFTMGYGVGDQATYPAQMQAACPALQAVNMGQGGYGVDQDYLWYKRDGTRLDANLLLFAVIAHDFYRMSADNFIGYAKPVLSVKDNRLVVGNVPVPATFGSRTTLTRARAFFESFAVVRTGRWLLGRGGADARDPFYGVVSDEVFAAAGLALDDLAAISGARNQRIALVYLPIAGLMDKEPTREAAWLEAYARTKGVAFVNLVADFKALPAGDFARMFRPDNHYTTEGNRFVAAAILRELAKQVPGFPACGTPPAR
jgi:hypothetical protein